MSCASKDIAQPEILDECVFYDSKLAAFDRQLTQKWQEFQTRIEAGQFRQKKLAKEPVFPENPPSSNQPRSAPLPSTPPKAPPQSIPRQPERRQSTDAIDTISVNFFGQLLSFKKLQPGGSADRSPPHIDTPDTGQALLQYWNHWSPAEQQLYSVPYLTIQEKRRINILDSLGHRADVQVELRCDAT